MPAHPDSSALTGLFSAHHLRRTKEFVRLFASRCCQVVLQLTSRPYAAPRGPVVVFAPHQDDEALGCGALIARKRNDGQPVHVVFLTDGAASHLHHPRVTPAEITAIRLQEARRVLALLGVDSTAIHFFDESDGSLNRVSSIRRESLVVRIAALLAELQPVEIFLPCNADGSSEHDAAFRFVAEAVERIHSRAMIWEYPVWLWWNPLTLLVQLAQTTGRCRAPTEDFLALKRRALSHYRSQLEPLPPQPEASLPRDLLRLIDPEAEYFFRFAPPSTRLQRSTPPVI